MTAARRSANEGGLSRKTGTYVSRVTGEVLEYTYWQASREAGAGDLPSGMTRKRITGSGRTRSEAAKRLEENWDAFKIGEARRGKTRLSGKVTVRRLYDEWQRNNQAGAVSEVMAAKYAGYFQNHILPHIGDRRVDSLTETELNLLFNQTLAAKVDKAGKPLLGGPARRNIYMALSGCLEFAVRNRYIAANPIRAVKAPRKAKPKDDIDGVLQDARRILDALQAGHPDECRFLLSFLGLRRSERLGLCWADIRGLDTDAPQLLIHQQLARGRAEGLYLKQHTKNGQDRTIVIPEPFSGALRRYRRQQQARRESSGWVEPLAKFADMLFLQPNGFPIDQNDDNEDWKRLLTGLGIVPWRAHLTRHVTATLLAQQPSVPITTVMSVLGHSSQSMSVYYAHVGAAQQVGPMTGFGAVIQGDRTAVRQDAQPSR